MRFYIGLNPHFEEIRLYSENRKCGCVSINNRFLGINPRPLDSESDAL